MLLTEPLSVSTGISAKQMVSKSFGVSVCWIALQISVSLKKQIISYSLFSLNPKFAMCCCCTYYFIIIIIGLSFGADNNLEYVFQYLFAMLSIRNRAKFI